MILLWLPFPVAIEESGHNLPRLRPLSQEVTLEVFYKGTFPTSWLSLDEQDARSVTGVPPLILLMGPKPLKGTIILL
jgi:hypothetical protein